MQSQLNSIIKKKIQLISVLFCCSRSSDTGHEIRHTLIAPLDEPTAHLLAENGLTANYVGFFFVALFLNNWEFKPRWILLGLSCIPG